MSELILYMILNLMPVYKKLVKIGNNIYYQIIFSKPISNTVSNFKL